MAFKFENRHFGGILAGLALLILDGLMLKDSPLFVPIIAVSVLLAASQFIIDLVVEARRQKEIEEEFPEFVRSFVDGLNSGMPPKLAVINASKEDYGALTPHVVRLAHQLEWAVPFRKAIWKFAESTGNPLIKKTIATVIEAESYGGNIEDVLKAITRSLVEVKKIRAERRYGIRSQIMQSYIIFIVFIGIIIVIQNFLIPYMQSVSASSAAMFGSKSSATINVPQKVIISFASFSEFVKSFANWLRSLNGIFIMLAVIQGFFAGLVIGKLAEGDIRMGIKHSVILMSIAFILISLSQGFVR